MVETTSMILNSSAVTAASGASTAAAAAAAASATRNRRAQAAYLHRAPRPNTTALNAASYMNHLRVPVLPRPPASHDVGVHIHYGGQCPHGAIHSPYYPSDNLASRNEGYSSQDHRIPQYPYYAGNQSSPCGCSACYWRDFLASDIEKYKATRRQLRETYIWNLRELVQRHQASPAKTREEKDGELEKLYWYYVGRVRENYDNHCQHHRVLFRDICLAWETPEKATLPEESIVPVSRALTPGSRRSSGSLRTPVTSSPRVSTPLSRMESSRQRSAEAVRVNKGKEKEVIPSTGPDVDTPGTVSVDDDGGGSGNRNGMDQHREEIQPTATAMQDGTTAKSPSKSSRVSMQQRWRQFWPARVRGKSFDKAELGQGTKMNGNEQDGGEQKSSA